MDAILHGEGDPPAHMVIGPALASHCGLPEIWDIETQAPVCWFISPAGAVPVYPEEWL
jgi:hypothetical protein